MTPIERLIRAIAAYVAMIAVTISWSALALLCGTLYTVAIHVPMWIFTGKERLNPLWSFLFYFSNEVLETSYRLCRIRVVHKRCKSFSIPSQVEEIAPQSGRMLRILIANHPTTPMVPALLAQMIADNGPIRLVVKGALLLTPLAPGMLIGLFTCIFRVKAPWARWLRQWSFRRAVRNAASQGVSLVIFPDQHRFSKGCRQKIICNFVGAPLGQIAEELQWVLPPRANGLWELITTARELDIPVEVVDYTIYSPAGQVTLWELPRLVGSTVVIKSHQVSQATKLTTPQECLEMLNGLWRSKDLLWKFVIHSRRTQNPE